VLGALVAVVVVVVIAVAVLLGVALDDPP